MVTGRRAVKRVADPALFRETVGRGERLAPGSTSVRRRVYTSGGALLYDNTWYSSYRGETRLVRVGTKPRPVAKPKKVGPTGPSGPSGPTGVAGVKPPQ